MAAVASMLPGLAEVLGSMRWFSGGGCVLERGDDVEVSIGGILIGRYQRDDIGTRNVILVGLAQDRGMHLGHLAEAFGLSDEMLRQVRRRFERDGLAAIATRGTTERLDADQRRTLEAMFGRGVSVSQAHRRVGESWGVSRATVGLVRKAWGAQLEEAAPPVDVPASTADAPASAPVLVEVAASSNLAGPSASTTFTDEAAAANEPPPAVADVGGGEFVQHAGAWLLLGALAKYGLYKIADEVASQAELDGVKVRVALDAAAIAFALGEHSVEGVRRLATPSAATLLRADHAPSADWVRRTIGRFADAGAPRFHLGMAARYIEAARAIDGPAVFYIDNHLRPYTGKETLRLGWRMQDKRALPGTTDYYLHDEDGRPVLRFVSASHEPLTDILPRLADLLRIALGSEQRILLAFDRAGAFPDALRDLREESFEFVTYERQPFRELRNSEFTKEAEIVDERVRYREFRVALGRGRGDVRRIAMQFDGERQMNLVAISQESAESLMHILRRRWRQENGLKHGVERWGINNLDGRKVVPVAPGTIIPNPARRRLENALKLASVHEGEARNRLARRTEHDPDFDVQAAAIDEALEQQSDLLARRPTTPTHAPVEDTELAGKLVEHDKGYKTVLDTIRIACANVEGDLAEALAPHLPRAAEAKKILASLLAAPGRIDVDASAIRVRRRSHIDA
jgi:hypothetical protein